MLNWAVWFKFLINKVIANACLFTLTSFSKESVSWKIFEICELCAQSTGCQKMYSVNTLVVAATASTGGNFPPGEIRERPWTLWGTIKTNKLSMLPRATFRQCQSFLRIIPKLFNIRKACMVYLLNFGMQFLRLWSTCFGEKNKHAVPFLRSFLRVSLFNLITCNYFSTWDFLKRIKTGDRTKYPNLKYPSLKYLNPQNTQGWNSQTN